jgi:short-subunit dehydrogenase
MTRGAPFLEAPERIGLAAPSRLPRRGPFRGRYRDAVAVVSGASAGLGRAIALELARAGATVVGVARRLELLEELEGRLVAVSPGSGVIACDVADTKRWVSVLRATEERLGRIDMLVNDAALDPGVGLADISIEDFRRTFEVNFFAAVAGTLAVLPGMLERGFGIVVNVSSDAARLPSPGPGAYPASKAALAAFSESLAYRVRPRGVAVHVVYPAWMPTAMGNDAVARGLRRPPRLARRSPEAVARLVLDRAGGRRLEISASRLVDLACVLRAVFPERFRSMRAGWERKGRRRRQGRAAP